MIDPQDYLPAILSLLIAAAGWFYMFYSRAAQKLSAIEQPGHNRLRVRLRRVNGGVMILMAVAFYIGWVALRRREAETAAYMMLAVLILMGTIVVLALVDVRLTHRLRRSRRSEDQS